MRTVSEVSRLTGVSVRALHHYDRVGLLKPAAVTEAGYRLYDEAALERLQQILLYRELEFPLKEIKQILDSPGFERELALEQQITLLTLKKERLEGLIDLAREIKQKGESKMDFKAFETKQIEEYTEKAKEAWGQTKEYREFEKKASGRSTEQQQALAAKLMEIFAEFGAIKTLPPESEVVQAQVQKLQQFLTAHYYTCTKEILSSLAELYAAGGEFTRNIDQAGGAGTGAFVKEAVKAYCGSATK